MNARIIEKVVEVDGRRFLVRKFDAFTGVKVSKLLIAKALPALQSALPALFAALREGTKGVSAAIVLDSLDESFTLDSVARALDLITGDDLDYVMRSALSHCYEDLPVPAQVMTLSGTYGATDVENDPLLVIRLVSEAAMWGLSDFFTGDRLKSILGPLFSVSPLNQLT